jgi:hypothetical protein
MCVYAFARKGGVSRITCDTLVMVLHIHAHLHIFTPTHPLIYTHRHKKRKTPRGRPPPSAHSGKKRKPNRHLSTKRLQKGKGMRGV